MHEWRVAPHVHDDLIDQLLHNRGIDLAIRDTFLNPDWDRDTHDPMLFRQMTEAVDAVFLALQNGYPITIHGDYDADGTCGSAVLFTTLRTIKRELGYEADVDVYLPDREKDGYGVAMHTIERLAREGTKLLITVDCGISNIEQLAKAHDLGMQAIVCDHHQLADSIPSHAILIHPLVPGEAYPNKHLCGTGVAFKLASALVQEATRRGANLPVGYEKWMMDLVAIATVTDVMPLLDENRTLEHYGLMTLAKTRRIGLQAIMNSARVDTNNIDTTSIGFRIGPRINAAGRLSSAKIAFDAIVAETAEEAEQKVAELEMLNKQRQQLVEAALKEVWPMVKEREDDLVHVIWSDLWIPGIIGLIAGKVANKTGKPTFALTRVQDNFVGSGRSDGNLHLVEAMRSCGDIFKKAGGHPQACGLTIVPEQLEAFRAGVNEFAKSIVDKEQKPIINVDAHVDLATVDWEIFNTVQKLKPFGQKNPEPTFLSEGLQVINAATVGKTNKHLKLTVNPPNGRVWKMIGFGFGEWEQDLTMGDKIDIVYRLQVNEWNGNRDLEAEIIDLRKSLEA